MKDRYGDDAEEALEDEGSSETDDESVEVRI